MRWPCRRPSTTSPRSPPGARAPPTGWRRSGWARGPAPRPKRSGRGSSRRRAGGRGRRPPSGPPRRPGSGSGSSWSRRRSRRPPRWRISAWRRMPRRCPPRRGRPSWRRRGGCSWTRAAAATWRPTPPRVRSSRRPRRRPSRLREAPAGSPRQATGCGRAATSSGASPRVSARVWMTWSASSASRIPPTPITSTIPAAWSRTRRQRWRTPPTTSCIRCGRWRGSSGLAGAPTRRGRSAICCPPC